MRVVHVGLGAGPAVFSRFGGAIQRRIAEVALAQARLQYDVTVFSPSTEFGTRHIDGVTVRDVRCHTRPPWVHLEYQARVVAEMMRRREPVDVLHFHSQPEGALAARFIPALRVLSYDNYYFRRGRRSGLAPIYRRLLGRFDLLLPCSTYCMDASAAYWQLPRTRIYAVPNGVSLIQFHPDPLGAETERAKLKLKGDVILYLGRVCEQKGTDTLLKAFASLRPRLITSPDLVLAGPIEQFGQATRRTVRERWEARIREVGAIYLGPVPEERLPGLLTLADIFVMPTRELEMFGMAAVEAQACGTPVIASDHGGLRETVPDGVGLRFAPGDSQALAHALARLLTDSELTVALGKRALAHARGYSWDVIAAKLDALYRAGLRMTPQSDV